MDKSNKAQLEVLQTLKKEGIPEEFLKEFGDSKRFIDPAHLKGIMILNRAELDYVLNAKGLLKDMGSKKLGLGLNMAAASRAASTPDPIPPKELIGVLKQYKIPQNLLIEFENQNRWIKKPETIGVQPFTALQITAILKNAELREKLAESNKLILVSYSQ